MRSWLLCDARGGRAPGVSRWAPVWPAGCRTSKRGPSTERCASQSGPPVAAPHPVGGWRLGGRLETGRLPAASGSRMEAQGGSGKVRRKAAKLTAAPQHGASRSGPPVAARTALRGRVRQWQPLAQWAAGDSGAPGGFWEPQGGPGRRRDAHAEACEARGGSRSTALPGGTRQWQPCQAHGGSPRTALPGRARQWQPFAQWAAGSLRGFREPWGPHEAPRSPGGSLPRLREAPGGSCSFRELPASSARSQEALRGAGGLRRL